MATATTDTKAQDTNKGAAAPAPAAGKVSDLSKEALMELIMKGSTDPKVFEQLRTLNTAEESKLKEKKGAVTKLIAEMEKYGITFLDLKEGGAQVPDLDKMFDLETIKLVAAPHFAGASNKPAKPPKEKSGEATTREGNIQYDGVKHNWTRNLDDAAKGPLFEAFKAGKSVKAFFVKPDDKAASARLIARLEREASEGDKKFSYSEANLKELGLTRASITAAIEAKEKADKAKAAKAAK